jgi:hypothetical protein
MREKRLSMAVRVCFFEGNRNRGSVAKLLKRASPLSAPAAVFPGFCLGFGMMGVVEKKDSRKCYSAEILKVYPTFCHEPKAVRADLPRAILA